MEDPSELGWIATALAAGVVPAGLLFRWHRRGGQALVPGPDLTVDLGLLGVLGLAASMVARGLGPAVVRQAGGTDAWAAVVGYAGLLVVAAALFALGLRIPGVKALLAGGAVRGLRGLGLGAVAYLSVVAPVLAVHWFNREHVVSPEDEHRVQEGLRIILDPSDRAAGVVLAVAVVTVVPYFEELIYRGFLQSAFRSALDRVLTPRTASLVAVVSGALVFAAVHDRFTWLPIFVLGLALGALWERTRSLWVSGGFHAAHNLLTLVWAHLWLPE